MLRLIVLTCAPRLPQWTAFAITRNEFPRLEIWQACRESLTRSSCSHKGTAFQAIRGAPQNQSGSGWNAPANQKELPRRCRVMGSFDQVYVQVKRLFEIRLPAKARRQLNHA